MSDTTQNLVMPIIQPAQAQKHVTHNEALLVLDGAVQLCLEAVGQEAPPETVAEGQIWALGPAPTGIWAGQAGSLAMRVGAGWLHLAPREGWRGWDRSSGSLRVFQGGAWVGLPLQGVEGLGIGASYDATNRLAVAAAATLLSHAGAGHQLKINKAAAEETGSLLFQTDWSGRAEMGLAGTDGFAIKVSADGAQWSEALIVAPASGQVSLPAGALLPSGSAATPALGFAGDADTGFHRPAADQIGAATGGVRRWLLTDSACQIDVPITGWAVTQSASDVTAGRLLRTEAGPAQAFRQGNVLGSVSQSAGVPTGALLERGSTAQGAYMRFADGTQICTQRLAVPSGVATATGALFMSESYVWTFPAPFVAPPAVSGLPSIDLPMAWLASGPTATSEAATSVRVMRTAALTTATGMVDLTAVGRWF